MLGATPIDEERQHAVLGDEESLIALNYADHPAINAEILTANGPIVLA